MSKEYYAHKSEDGRLQPLSEHLKNTAHLASEFAKDFGASAEAELAGYYHDIGKASEAFQKRLLYGGPKVDHSSAGMVVCNDSRNYLTALCIAGHHRGLYDVGNSKTDNSASPTYFGRLIRAKKECESYTEDIALPDKRENDIPGGFYMSLWTRMLFSCLVDADFLDTENFINPKVRGEYDALEDIKNCLFEYLSTFPEPKNELNKLRRQVQEDCVAAADEKRGIFSLTAPTGAGKTLSSLAFALKHACRHKMKRIIYVIPYTNIIEQTADVFRNIIGDKNVLEHHSDVDCYVGENGEENTAALLASENWDSPVIITTAVQFFESLYASKVSKCRKIHNITNSVVIFDEVQSIPAEHLLPCVAVMGCLVEHFNSSIVLCSATQPYINDILIKYAPSYSVKEICSNPEELAEKLKRVNYQDAGSISIGALAAELTENKQVLCIVNRRKTAKELFNAVSVKADGCYHLSTLMTPTDRKKTLKTIQDRIKSNLPCRVVSTSLVEAGVELDFPVLYREKTGLDSIIQAGGRCNREGKREKSKSIVYYFTLSDVPALKALRVNIGATNEVTHGSDDISSIENIKKYFLSYRDLIAEENLDTSEAVKKLTEGDCGCYLPFKTVAENFHLIDDITKTIYIPCKENEDLIKQIKASDTDRFLFRKMGKYAVNIHENHFKKLMEASDIEIVDDGVAILSNLKQYNPQTGLSLITD